MQESKKQATYRNDIYKMLFPTKLWFGEKEPTLHRHLIEIELEA